MSTTSGDHSQAREDAFTCQDRHPGLLRLFQSAPELSSVWRESREAHQQSGIHLNRLSSSRPCSGQLPPDEQDKTRARTDNTRGGECAVGRLKPGRSHQTQPRGSGWRRASCCCWDASRGLMASVRVSAFSRRMDARRPLLLPSPTVTCYGTKPGKETRGRPAMSTRDAIKSMRNSWTRFFSARDHAKTEGLLQLKA